MVSSSSSTNQIRQVAKIMEKLPVTEQERIAAAWIGETPEKDQKENRKRKAASIGGNFETGTSSLPERQVIPDLLIEEISLTAIPNKVVRWLDNCQKWGNMFRTAVEADVNLIRSFYQNLSITSNKNAARAQVTTNGVEWEFTDKEIAAILKVPGDGVSVFHSGAWPEDRGEILSLLFRNPDKEVKDLECIDLSTSGRALHQIVTRGITPRLEDVSCVTAHDAYVMASIIKEEQVHLPILMMEHMRLSIQDESLGLPFPGLVKQLLFNAGFYNRRREVPLVHRFDSSLLGQTCNADVHEEVQRLSDRVEELHGKYDNILFWVKTIAEKLSPELKEEMDGESSSDDVPW